MEWQAGHGKGVSWHWPVLKTPSLADPELGNRILIIAAGPDNGRQIGRPDYGVLR